MWTTLTLVVLAASSSPTLLPAGVTVGQRVRLSAGPAVHVPGLHSGTRDRFTTRGAYERRDGLLVFTRGDGSVEAVIAPGAEVTGVLVGADPTFLHLRRADMEPADRIHRGSVSRVEAFQGRRGRARMGAVIGGVAGGLLGLAAYHVFTVPTADWPRVNSNAAGATLYCGAMGLAVGAGLGALDRHDNWGEVPLEALPGRRLESPETGRDLRLSGGEEVSPRPGHRSWAVVGVKGGSLAFAIVPAGEGREASPSESE